MPWYLLAFGSAIVWGLHYVILSNAFKYVSPQTALLLTTIVPSMVVFGIWYNQVTTDLQNIMAMDLKQSLPIFALFFSSTIGTLLLYHAIIGKTAVHAAMIEITYPIFVAIFSVIFLVGHTITTGTIIGGIIILCGAWVVIWTN